MKALSLEAICEAVEYLSDPDGNLSKRQQDWLAQLPPVLDRYLQHDAGMQCDFSWRRGDGPGPSLHWRMWFYRARVGLRVKSIQRPKLKFRHQLDVIRGSYEMELPVFIDVVKGVEAAKSIPHGLPLVAPSFVWLEVTECPSIPLAQTLNPIPASVELPDTGVDGELACPFDLPGDFPLEPSDMQLINEMVERCAKVEQNLPDSERPVRSDAGHLRDVEAILATRPVYLGADGPALFIGESPLYFLAKLVQLGFCPPEFIERPFEAAGHTREPMPPRPPRQSEPERESMASRPLLGYGLRYWLSRFSAHSEPSI